MGVSGLEKVDCISGIENYDVSGLVSGHLQYISPQSCPYNRYRFVLGEILEKVGLHGLNEKVIAIRAKEGEREEEQLEVQVSDTQGGEAVDDKALIGELEKTHLHENH